MCHFSLSTSQLNTNIAKKATVIEPKAYTASTIQNMFEQFFADAKTLSEGSYIQRVTWQYQYMGIMIYDVVSSTRIVANYTPQTQNAHSAYIASYETGTTYYNKLASDSDRPKLLNFTRTPDSEGNIFISFSDLGISSRPSHLTVTSCFSNVFMAYVYDSSSSSVCISAHRLDGTAFTSIIRGVIAVYP